MVNLQSKDLASTVDKICADLAMVHCHGTRGTELELW